MNPAKSRSSDRISRRNVDKFSDRRAELAEAALQTLSELGYARTSLREIAQNTAFSHGVLHYYFTDKADLITCSIRQYKARCVVRYDEIIASAKTAEDLRKGFAAGMADTLRAEAPLHRLWYDVRTQSLFEPSFRKDVAAIDDSLERMIWRIVSEYAALSRRALGVSSSVAYGIFDGIFEHGLMRFLHGEKSALRDLDTNVQEALAALPLVALAPKASKAPKVSKVRLPRSAPKPKSARATKRRARVAAPGC